MIELYVLEYCIQPLLVKCEDIFAEFFAQLKYIHLCIIYIDFDYGITFLRFIISLFLLNKAFAFFTLSLKSFILSFLCKMEYFIKIWVRFSSEFFLPYYNMKSYFKKLSVFVM